MANSDNVLRGGLTGKYVDVPELLRTVSFEGISPMVIEGTRMDTPLEAFYESPTEDFRLGRIDLWEGRRLCELCRVHRDCINHGRGSRHR